MSKEDQGIGGILEKVVADENGFYGFLRNPKNDYQHSGEDIYVPPRMIKKYKLLTGDHVVATTKKPGEGELYDSATKITSVNGIDIDNFKRPEKFEKLKPMYPNKKFNIDFSVPSRIIDLIAPIGMGQRTLIVSPPKSGKTMLMKDIANGIIRNNDMAHVMILLIDERPEEVTDMQDNVPNAEIISSTFDEDPERHERCAFMSLERAKRMVEYGKHVVILLDSITRLARACNTTCPSSGKVMSGGLDSYSMQFPKKFLGAARNTTAGSLTIIATALIDTGSKMDDIIFEEFKGTGNSEIVLSRKLAERRMFPALDILKSGARREELIMGKDHLDAIYKLRGKISNMPQHEAMDEFIKKVKNSKDNETFISMINKLF